MTKLIYQFRRNRKEIYELGLNDEQGNRPKEKVTALINIYSEDRIDILIRLDSKKDEKTDLKSILEELLEGQEQNKSGLEGKVSSEKENIIEFPYNPERYEERNYRNKNGFNYLGSVYRDETSGARVVYVDSSQLPSGYGWRALGMYVPGQHTIYIDKNLPPDVMEFVYWHEVAHAVGIYDEGRADSYAEAKTGMKRAA